MVTKTLFISDLHLGSPLFKSTDKIMNLLSTNYDRVIIIGDIIDGWTDDVDHIIIKYKRLIDKINSLNDVILIRGNHDPAMEILESVFHNVNVTDRYIDDDIIVVHGHEWDTTLEAGKFFFSIHEFLVKFGFNFKSFIRNVIYKILSIVYRKNVDKDLISNMEKNIVSNCLEYRNIIIAGHTHVPKIVKKENFIYINTGDWVYNKSYVEYRDGEFNLIK